VFVFRLRGRVQQIEELVKFGLVGFRILVELVGDVRYGRALVAFFRMAPGMREGSESEFSGKQLIDAEEVGYRMRFENDTGR
jgi:hypothetical protein